MIDSHTDEEKSKKLSRATRGFGLKTPDTHLNSQGCFKELLRSLFLG